MKKKCVVIFSGMVNVVNVVDLFIEYIKILNKIDLI